MLHATRLLGESRLSKRIVVIGPLTLSYSSLDPASLSFLCASVINLLTADDASFIAWNLFVAFTEF